MTAAARARLMKLAATAVALTASLAVVGAYVVRAGLLVAYPWDWSPDEGLFLDHARRVAPAAQALHAQSFVPFPSAYGPLLLLLLSPVSSSSEALFGARLVALGWTLTGTLAVYLLARREAPPLLAGAACALALVPFDITFWHMLIRPDGPMLALLLLAAVPLLPAALARGGDRLSGSRLALGTALLLAAVLAKATAAIHAGPMVFGWLLVDRRSALRLMLWLGTAGLLVLAGLQWLTAGGFLWVRRVWSYHPVAPWLPGVITLAFLALAWPLLLFALATLLASRERRAVLRDGAVLLLAGAAIVLPLTAKTGASWNYLVPAVPALAVVTARCWARGAPIAGVPRAAAGAAIVAAFALGLALARPFPLPSAEDERTARAFYTFVAQYAHEERGPILALRPEFAYFYVGQPVEMEGSCFAYLARDHAPGTELIEQRLSGARYSLVIWTWPLPDVGSYRESLERSYAAAGSCNLGYYFGEVTSTLLPRRDMYRQLQAPAGTRCESAVARQPPTT